MDRNDLADFRDYVRARGPALLRTAYLLTGHRADAEDLLQAALVKTCISWGRVDDRGALDAYVRRIMVNTHISWWRGRHLDIYPTADLPEQEEDDQTWRTDLHDALLRALERLPDRQRAALVLRYFEDMSEAEIAARLGVSVGTVKSSVSRGVAKLRDDESLAADFGSVA
ncbi:SigE family RNA polymerase sigma factor [Allonocardiopsis opalescens]|uniref:RNA polymerase sigma-70 factor (Sigma-E family) n=1 Tax=Allonocardiopsis opalescens TaxID=1144618 RepID=A0A2T0Q7H3_9ACTN|nr:SigE family RNA polymerase sigma factor [Allonocardiopsis opalescens]PRX99768.1 RNA polymerase sigma-70 factor (sigma-E family) [Allonocardiopsis opalescens]